MAKEEYDGGTFTSYPERRGLKSGDIRMSVWKNKEEAAPFLQEWLFFGLMAVFFGVKIRTEEFLLETTQGKRIITTKALPRYVQEWCIRCERMPKGLLKDYHDLRREYLILASRHNPPVGIAGPSWATVSLSISVLIQSLTDASIGIVNLMHGYTSEGRTLFLKISDYFHIEEPYLEKRMLTHGWCPHEVARIRSKDFPCTTMYYLSCLRRDFRGKNHGSCSEAQCIVDEVPEDAYETQHTVSTCTCDHIAPPMGRLRAIVRNGGIPIIACSLGSSNELDGLGVLEWKPDLEYVAVSHVWSDGKGNPSGNLLPECQVLELCRLVSSMRNGREGIQGPSTGDEPNHPTYADTRQELSPTISPASPQCLFWIDSLCIPVGEQYRDLRRKAILRMREIYANAWGVLALDAEVARFSGLRTVEENLARIVCSLWMRRCWTLQELALSKRCYVRFSDTFFDLRGKVKPDTEHWPIALITDYEFDSTHHYLSKQFMDIVDLPNSLDPFKSGDEENADRFTRVWNCMTWRSTAREEDRYAILAILLELNLESVLSSSSIAQRMRTILASQRAIPMSIFTLKCPKQREDGYTWAPAEFSATAIDMKNTEWPGVGLLDAGGLNVTCGGMILSGLVPYAEFYAFKDPNTNRWSLLMHQFLENDPAKDEVTRNGHKNRACFIFDSGPSCAARLSLQARTEDDVLVVRYACRVGVLEIAPEHLPPGVDDLDPRKSPGVGFGFNKTHIPLVHAEKTRSDQRWRIC